MTPNPDQLEHLRNLISQGKLLEVFQQLPALFPVDAPEISDLIVLEGQFLTNQRDESLGTADRDATRRTSANISQSLLALINRLEDHRVNPDSAAYLTFKDQLRGVRALFIDDDRLPHAFSRLERLIEERFPEQMPSLSPLWADFNTSRNDFKITQTIDRETYMLTFRRVVQGLTTLLQTLEEADSKISGPGVQLGSELAQVNCNRKKILHRFLRAFEENETAETPLHVYLLSHQQYGQAESLARRLVTQLMQQYPKVKYNGFHQIPIQRIDILADDEPDDSQFSLRKGFNRGLRPEARSLHELLQKTESHYSQFIPWTYLPFVLHLKAPAAAWNQAGAPGLQWFLQEFCACPGREKRIPVLFLIVQIEPTPVVRQQSSGWRGLFGKKKATTPEQLDTYSELKKLTAQLPAHVTLLPPLRRVMAADLRDWYSEYESNEKRREDQVQKMIERLGATEEGWHMSHVEELLKEIVESHQNAAYNL